MFYPKNYVTPTLSQQFLSKELESLQPKTVMEKINFSVCFYLGSGYFAANDVLPLHSTFC